MNARLCSIAVTFALLNGCAADGTRSSGIAPYSAGSPRVQQTCQGARCTVQIPVFETDSGCLVGTSYPEELKITTPGNAMVVHWTLLQQQSTGYTFAGNGGIVLTPLPGNPQAADVFRNCRATPDGRGWQCENNRRQGAWTYKVTVAGPGGATCAGDPMIINE